ncbi:MAG: GntR family transcriptional regulator [Thermomicrobiales bacterium]
MSSFKVLAPPSLTESVAAELRHGISIGHLKPGDRLVEADLAARMGISRAPVREALRQLAFEGLVAGRTRRGYVVRGLTTAEMIEIYDLRVMLEPVLASAAVARLQPDGLAELRSIVERMREAARHDRWAEVVDADRQFHALVGRFSGRTMTAQIFDHLNEQVRRFTALMITSYTNIELMVDEHDSLLAALASGSPDRAGNEMRLHLEDARRRLHDILGDPTDATETADAAGAPGQPVAGAARETADGN